MLALKTTGNPVEKQIPRQPHPANQGICVEGFPKERGKLKDLIGVPMGPVWY